MTHPNPKSPGNVPLYRCPEASRCFRFGCDEAEPHQRDSNCEFHDEDCPHCVEVGFRTPPDCHYCIHVQSASQCAKCESKDKYTPRQPGKEKV